MQKYMQNARKGVLYANEFYLVGKKQPIALRNTSFWIPKLYTGLSTPHKNTFSYQIFLIQAILDKQPITALLLRLQQFKATLYIYDIDIMNGTLNRNDYGRTS